MKSILERMVDPNLRIVHTVVWFLFCLSPFSGTQTVVPMPSQTVLGIICWRLRIGLSVVVFSNEWRRRHWQTQEYLEHSTIQDTWPRIK